MSASGININYEQSKQEVRELRSIANALEHVSEDLSKTMKSLSGCWEANSASQYTDKGMHMVRKIRNTSDNMQKLANTMLDITKALKQADEQNKKKVQGI